MTEVRLVLNPIPPPPTSLKRPIGTRFDQYIKRDQQSTAFFGRKVVWEVVGYQDAFDEFGRPYTAEVIEPVAEEEWDDDQ